MKNVFLNCIEMYENYFGNKIYLIMFLLAMLYIFFLEKDKMKKKYFIGFFLIFSFIYWCPITAYIITTYCVEANVYWRMFWMLPMTIVIAYVVVELIHYTQKKHLMLIVLVILAAFVWNKGVTIYDGYAIIEANNVYKIENEIINICDIVKEDAQKKGIEDRGIIVVNELVNNLKQYDGEIRMPYGRDMIRGIDGNTRAQEIFFCVNNPYNWDYLATLAREDGYQYLVYHAGLWQNEIVQVGYSYLDRVGNYYIYYLEK